MAERTPSRDALLLSMLLTLFGSCGMSNGLATYRTVPLPTADTVEVGDGPGGRELSHLTVTLLEVQFDAPTRRPLGLVNCAVSGLLVVGAFLLGMRKRYAAWFVRQVLLANLLFVGVKTAAEVRRFEARRPALVTAITSYVDAVQRERPPPGEPVPGASQAPSVFRGLQVLLVLFGCVNAGAHLVLFLRAGRPTIGEFLTADEDEVT